MSNDPAETDPAALSASEDLDEDRLRADPLEKGVEPPEHWTAADRHGTTPSEVREGETLEERLHEERPDVAEHEPEAPPRPVAATPATELDESIDDMTGDVEPIMPEDSAGEPADPAVARGQNADEGGESVADAIRTPEEPE